MQGLDERPTGWAEAMKGEAHLQKTHLAMICASPLGVWTSPAASWVVVQAGVLRVCGVHASADGRCGRNTPRSSDGVRGAGDELVGVGAGSYGR